MAVPLREFEKNVSRDTDHVDKFKTSVLIGHKI